MATKLQSPNGTVLWLTAEGTSYHNFERTPAFRGQLPGTHMLTSACTAACSVLVRHKLISVPLQASDSLQSCIVLQRENGSATCSHYMVDRLQDKVHCKLVLACQHFIFCVVCSKSRHCWQVIYLDGRIGEFAAAFEDATGCHPSHPVYAACQVCTYGTSPCLPI